MDISEVELLSEKTGEVRDYFERLGYEVTWDYSRILGKRWWEISKDGERVVQIDMEVPLAAIVEDLRRFHAGQSASSGVDYSLCGPIGDTMLELYRAVFEESEAT